jgi:cytochrome c oxidase subunit 3
MVPSAELADAGAVGAAGPAGAHHDPHDHHDPNLAHHFEDLEQQRESHTLGMWLFLVQEIMFFGGMFAGYAVYRYFYPVGWMAGSQQLNVTIGAANTAVLLFSSFTMALAVRAAQLGHKRGVVQNLLLTMLFGTIFLVVKYFEYRSKLEHGLMPFPVLGLELAPEVARIPGMGLFFGFYFTMTGMHALHMIIGFGLFIWAIVHTLQGKVTPERHAVIENLGLYWHFVDIVWIFLFPLLYLLGLNGEPVVGGH